MVDHTNFSPIFAMLIYLAELVKTDNGQEPNNVLGQLFNVLEYFEEIQDLMFFTMRAGDLVYSFILLQLFTHVLMEARQDSCGLCLFRTVLNVEQPRVFIKRLHAILESE